MDMTVKAIKHHEACNDGYCRNCDAITRYGCTEPDASEYHCDDCCKKQVYGIQEAVVRGWIRVGEEVASGARP